MQATAADELVLSVAAHLDIAADLVRDDSTSWALRVIESTIREADAPDGVAVTLAECAHAARCNATGHYEIARQHAERASGRRDVGQVVWALGELVEASMRSGRPELAVDAVRRLDHRGDADVDEVRALRARSAAQLASGAAAERLYREAIERFVRSGLELHAGRAELLYGEWLRRESRRVDARVQLRSALRRFTQLGAPDFADRARRELSATSETAHGRSMGRRDELTAQEAEIARLAAEGYTNPEIAGMLYISRRTVEWHLRKVFNKLGVASRRALLVRGGR
jgi:ATP/maltotriose-dependent transcriptional regulator MalT